MQKIPLSPGNWPQGEEEGWPGVKGRRETSLSLHPLLYHFVLYTACDPYGKINTVIKKWKLNVVMLNVTHIELFGDLNLLLITS